MNAHFKPIIAYPKGKNGRIKCRKYIQNNCKHGENLIYKKRGEIAKEKQKAQKQTIISSCMYKVLQSKVGFTFTTVFSLGGSLEISSEFLETEVENKASIAAFTDLFP